MDGPSHFGLPTMPCREVGAVSRGFGGTSRLVTASTCTPVFSCTLPFMGGSLPGICPRGFGVKPDLVEFNLLLGRAFIIYPHPTISDSSSAEAAALMQSYSSAHFALFFSLELSSLPQFPPQ